MPTSTIVNLNGQMIPAEESHLPASNSSFRHGVGLFETIRVSQNKIPLFALHADRLFHGMNLIGLANKNMDPGMLSKQIMELCKKNGHTDAARVRVTVFMNDKEPGWLIESFAFDKQAVGKYRGLRIDSLPHGRKSIDSFSNLKATSFLLYATAAQYAAETDLDEVIVLNQHDRIADASISNLFCIKDGTIHTPPLSEGPVAGVMRRWLLKQASHFGLDIRETAFGPEFLVDADEVFLTNALRGVRTVASFGENLYGELVGSRIAVLVETVLSGRDSGSKQ